MWAAAEALSGVENFTAVERDSALIEIGERLAEGGNAALLRAKWLLGDLSTFRPAPHDVVVLSYAIGELPDVLAAARAAWDLARVALVVIEPGTPAAFARVVAVRDMLIEMGAQIAAPCPHHNRCPLAEQNDWCHFSARVERSAVHRRLKGGELGYEDEKFSYVIACRTAVEHAEARIVRHPLKHPGHIKLTLCTPQEIQRPTITKSQKELYRAARKAEWGDAWPPSAETSPGRDS